VFKGFFISVQCASGSLLVFSVQGVLTLHTTSVLYLGSTWSHIQSLPGLFFGDKVVGTWHWPLTSFYDRS